MQSQIVKVNGIHFMKGSFKLSEIAGVWDNAAMNSNHELVHVLHILLKSGKIAKVTIYDLGKNQDRVSKFNAFFAKFAEAISCGVTTRSSKDPSGIVSPCDNDRDGNMSVHLVFGLTVEETIEIV